MTDAVYKICPPEAWEAARRAGIYTGSADDRRDGYIHLSSPAQVAGTLARHFAGAAALVLLRIDAAALGERLRWEASSGGRLYPHLYGTLPLSAVIAETPLARDAAGHHILPAELASC